MHPAQHDGPSDHSTHPRLAERSDGGPAGATPGTEDWERPPARVPVLRWRGAAAAVLVLLVAAAAWWSVSWLSAPAPPAAAPAPAAASAPPGAAPSAVPPSPPSPPGEVSPGGVASGPDETAAVSGAPSGPDAGPAGEIRVHVVGEVRRPGVVTLGAGARTTDAVRAAGGPTRQARTERINLAAPLADGDQVLVPSASTPSESLAAAAGSSVAAGVTGGTAGGGVGASGRSAVSGGPDAPGRSAGAGGTGDRVDLNRADAAELETLPGVGPSTAEKIIAHREGVGPFTGLQDLDAVPGVGPATLERLREHVSW